VLLIINFSEAVQGNIIFAYLPFMCARLGAPEAAKIGLLASCYYLAQVVTIPFWGRLADRVGRRPVLLLGMLATAGTMALFGFAESYAAAVAARALTGGLNSNIGIAKVYVGEISTARTQARAFSYLSLTWGVGTVLAPALGGFLADPAANFPGSSLAAVPLARAHPYVLPALVSSAVSLLALGLGACLLPETPAWTARARRRELEREAGRGAGAGAGGAGGGGAGGGAARAARAAADADPGGEGGGGGDDDDEGEAAPMLSPSAAAGGGAGAGAPAPAPAPPPAPAPARGGAAPAPPRARALPDDATTLQLLSDAAVGGCILNYALLALVQIVFDELLPIFLKTPPGAGGLGWSSSEVGSVQIAQGGVQMFMQLFVFWRLARAWPLATLFRASLAPFVPVLAAWPALALAGAGAGAHVAVALALGVKAGLLTVSFTAIMLLINNAAPASHLGAVTGVAQSVASLMRALGPSAGGALYDAATGAAAIGGPTARLCVVYGAIAAVAAAACATSYLVPAGCDEPPPADAPAEPAGAPGAPGAPAPRRGGSRGGGRRARGAPAGKGAGKGTDEGAGAAAREAGGDAAEEDVGVVAGHA